MNRAQRQHIDVWNGQSLDQVLTSNPFQNLNTIARLNGNRTFNQRIVGKPIDHTPQRSTISKININSTPYNPINHTSNNFFQAPQYSNNNQMRTINPSNNSFSSTINNTNSFTSNINNSPDINARPFPINNQNRESRYENNLSSNRGITQNNFFSTNRSNNLNQRRTSEIENPFYQNIRDDYDFDHDSDFDIDLDIQLPRINQSRQPNIINRNRQHEERKVANNQRAHNQQEELKQDLVDFSAIANRLDRRHHILNPSHNSNSQYSGIYSQILNDNRHWGSSNNQYLPNPNPDAIWDGILQIPQQKTPKPSKVVVAKNYKKIKYNKKRGEEDGQCPICLKFFIKNEDIYQTNCKHLFHRECLDNWIKLKPSCPNCRRQLQ